MAVHERPSKVCPRLGWTIHEQAKIAHSWMGWKLTFMNMHKSIIHERSSKYSLRLGCLTSWAIHEQMKKDHSWAGWKLTFINLDKCITYEWSSKHSCTLWIVFSLDGPFMNMKKWILHEWIKIRRTSMWLEASFMNTYHIVVFTMTFWTVHEQVKMNNSWMD